MPPTNGKQLVPLGPWPQGLYNVGPIEDVPRGYFFDALNVDVMPNGVLSARRGFHDIDCGGGRVSPVVSILGDAWESSEQYVLAQRTSAGALTELLSIKAGAPVAYSTTYTDRVFTSASKYGNLVYFISNTAGKSVTAPSAAGGVALTTVAAIPAGDTSAIIKDRLFVVNKSTSRVYYSKATDPTIWSAPDGGFFDVDPGNGQEIKAIAFSGNYIYIFKSGATYLFTFTTDPAIDGYLRKIADIGGDDALFFEGSIYLINKTGLYRVVNTAFELLSRDVDVSYIPAPRLWRIRELIIFNNTNLNCFYVFNARTKSWTKYDSTVADVDRPNRVFGEAFETTFGQKITWVTRGNDGVLTSYNTNVPANADGDNRDYHLGDASANGVAPSYMVQTGLVAPGSGVRLARLGGVILDVTAKHAHNNQFSVSLVYNTNTNTLSDVELVADVPNHGDIPHDGESWSGTTRAYNSTPDSPVAYRVYSTGITVVYLTNSEDSVFNFEIRNVYTLVTVSNRELDTTSTVANA